MAELKVCPFCGRTPKVENCGSHRYFVKCKCGIEQSGLCAQRCDAIRRWNRRKEGRAKIADIIEAYTKGFEDGADAVKSVKDEQERSER